MPAVSNKPFVLKDLILSIEGDDYATSVTEVSFTPSSSIQTWQGGTPEATFTDVTTATWTCTISYGQDWSNPDSLSFKLHNEETASWDVLFTPVKGSGQPAVKATLVVTPGAIGGQINGWANATVTLGVSGKPEFIPAV